MKKTLVLLILAVVLAGLVVYLVRSPAGDQAPSPAADAAGQQDPGNTTDPKPQADGGPARPKADPGGVKRRFYANQAKANDARISQQTEAVSSPVRQPDQPFEYSPEVAVLANEVERALDDIDTEAMKALWRRNTSCQGVNLATGDDLQRTLDKIDMAQSRQRRPDDLKIQNAFDQTRLAEMKRFERCAWKFHPETNHLRSQLEGAAQSGDVIGRFIYATVMMPSPLEPEYQYQVAVWADNALTFTMANILENQSLGYLAMAMSYSTGLFTPRNKFLAEAWQLTSSSCPGSGPQMSRSDINSLFGNVLYISDTGESMGQQFIDWYCR